LFLLFGSLFSVGFISCHLLWQLRGIEFDKKKAEGYIPRFVRSFALVVFYFYFFPFFFFRFILFFSFSLFSYKLKVAKKQLQNHKQLIDIESYEIYTHSIIHDNIDEVLHSNGIFRLDAFSYTVGDCLFDAFQVLLHFCYSSTDLHNVLIDYFLGFLKNGDTEALESYEYELESNFVRQLHGIHDVATYFSKLRLSASPILPAHERGLWGDTFCIRWLSNWLNISIEIWSLTRKTRYLLFKKIASNNPYCILFHDANADSGHYEPLQYRKLSI
jgi:hypothetical protein